MIHPFERAKEREFKLDDAAVARQAGINANSERVELSPGALEALLDGHPGSLLDPTSPFGHRVPDRDVAAIGIEALAFYVPRRAGPDTGIYVRSTGLATLAQSFRTSLADEATGPPSSGELIAAALDLLIAHERFHEHVENVTDLVQSVRPPASQDVWENTRAARHANEEALATAGMFDAIAAGAATELQRQTGTVYRELLLQGGLEEFLRRTPPEYQRGWDLSVEDEERRAAARDAAGAIAGLVQEEDSALLDMMLTSSDTARALTAPVFLLLE